VCVICGTVCGMAVCVICGTLCGMAVCVCVICGTDVEWLCV